jgi:formylglycine-generating enzyme required for sulfatase activity
MEVLKVKGLRAAGSAALDRGPAGLMRVLVGLLVVTSSACTGAAATVRPAVPGSPSAATTPAAHTAGEVRTDASGIEQVWVPAGSFLMGTDEATIARLTAQDPPGFVLGEFKTEQPQHRVTLTKGYWIDRYEVTNGAFAAFVDAGGYKDRANWSAEGWTWLSGQPANVTRYCVGDLPKDPVRCVTWYEAEAYATWRGGHLPSEAEWEYAARGPQSLMYPWGNDFDASRCNVIDKTGPVPVGSYAGGASWVGANDMAGNAMEWVRDWLADDYYASSPSNDPTGPAAGEKKVEKGGWWGSNLFVARSAYRHFEDAPDYADPHIGFRIAIS